MSRYWLSQARRGGGGGMRIHAWTLLISQLASGEIQQAAGLEVLLTRNPTITGSSLMVGISQGDQSQVCLRHSSST
jgi:hypothetical protein